VSRYVWFRVAFCSGASCRHLKEGSLGAGLLETQQLMASEEEWKSPGNYGGGQGHISPCRAWWTLALTLDEM
jgi:hypothetical protein